MKRILVILLALVLGACANIKKIEGEQLVRERLSLTLPDAWNKVAIPGYEQPYDAWTQEGLTLDELRLWAGVRPGQGLLEPRSASAGQTVPRVPTFATGLSRDRLVSLFESVYAADGSTVNVTRMEPGTLAGLPGVRFEFALVRKRHDLEFKGVGWASVHNDELFAATFVAPRLTFFPRLLPKAEAVVRSARIGK